MMDASPCLVATASFVHFITIGIRDSISKRDFKAIKAGQCSFEIAVIDYSAKEKIASISSTVRGSMRSGCSYPLFGSSMALLISR